MFTINDYPELLLHIKTIAGRIYQTNTSGWHGCFCPYCDDATRTINPRHGHFWIAPSFPYGHCFRCGVQVGLGQFLLDTKFTNQELIQRIRRISKFTYGTDSSRTTSFNRAKIRSIDVVMMNMKNEYINVRTNFPKQYIQYIEYIKERCLEINPINFLMQPRIINNDIAVMFLNYDGQRITTRSISNNKSRYYKEKGEKNFYYFQDISNIDEYDTITITEGAFDVINLYNYNYDFRDSFFIAIGDSNYKGLLESLINMFLLIGEYKIKIVFDRNIKRIDQLTQSILNITNVLNPQIEIQMFQPPYSKDVSELMLLTRIK